jgi:hypothetical protein
MLQSLQRRFIFQQTLETPSERLAPPAGKIYFYFFPSFLVIFILIFIVYLLPSLPSVLPIQWKLRAKKTRI